MPWEGWLEGYHGLADSVGDSVVLPRRRILRKDQKYRAPTSTCEIRVSRAMLKAWTPAVRRPQQMPRYPRIREARALELSRLSRFSQGTPIVRAVCAHWRARLQSRTVLSACETKSLFSSEILYVSFMELHWTMMDVINDGSVSSLNPPSWVY